MHVLLELWAGPDPSLLISRQSAKTGPSLQLAERQRVLHSRQYV